MASQAGSAPNLQLNAGRTSMIIDTEPVDEFDYLNIRYKFYEKVESYFNDTQQIKVKKWTKELVNETIAEVKEALSCTLENHQSNVKQSKLIAQYGVVEQNGKDILIYKNKASNNDITQVISIDEYFDVILEAHSICGHGGNNKTMNLINPNYFIPQVFVNIFLNLCNVCKQRRLRRDKFGVKSIASNSRKSALARFNSTVQVGFVSMIHRPDGTYKYILSYVDKTTRYILLRAINSSDSDFEISMELLKIFLDFGPPKVIETYSFPILYQAVGLLKYTWPVWDILVVQLVGENIIPPRKVVGKLERWMNASNSKNWAVGCRLVQIEMNTTQISGKPFTPYSSVFGFNPNYISLPKKPPTKYKDNHALPDTVVIKSDDEDDIHLIKDVDDEVQCISLIPEEKLSNQILEANKEIVEVFESGSQNISNTNHETMPERNGILKNLLSGSLKKCHVCYLDMILKYNCINCSKDVHFFCTRKFYSYDTGKPVLQTLCLLCKSTLPMKPKRS